MDLDLDLSRVKTLVTTYGARLVTGLAILILGALVIHLVLRLLRRRINRKVNPRIDPTVASFIQNFARFLLYTLLVLTAVNIMGVPMTTVVALLGSAGVAVSLAMQGALSNLIGGVILLLLKPIRAGEYVKVNDCEGTVQGIGVFYTDLVTFDGKHVSIPNSSMTNTPITNFTREGRRRVDVTFPVSYLAPIDRVFEVLNGLVARTDRVLPDPAPQVRLTSCASSSMDYAVRLWTKTEDYWDVYFFLIEQGKRALDEAGIPIPYQQVDVHLHDGAPD